MENIRFEPEAFTKAKAKVKDVLKTCMGFHSPEISHFCSKCVTAALQTAAYGERERCALYLESKGQNYLAEELRSLE